MGEQQFSTSSWLWRFTDVYDMLWKMVIRPPRDLYSPDELGPDKFRLGKHVYIRHDLELTSSRGVLQCSHFLPAKGVAEARPCVVYLHGNCSSRLEAFDALPVLLPLDVSVFSMDLSGSGRSDGEYISLGYHEEKDLQTCLDHLRELPTVTSIGLWGRSMGASTSILRVAEDSSIAACVLDSAFKDLKSVAEELVGKGRFPLPTFLTGWAFDMVRTEVSSRAGFDILELSPISRAPKAACAAFFGVASDDTFVLPHHTQALHDAWGGHKHFRVFEGGHNGIRPMWFLEEAADFLSAKLKDRSQSDNVPDGLPAATGAQSINSGPEDSAEGDELPDAGHCAASSQRICEEQPDAMPLEDSSSLQISTAEGFRAAAVKAQAQPESTSIPEGLTVLEQLTYLGFGLRPAEWASR
eukprot:CAMPEP_0181467714 /NCGR_PEP_ID=MMETSP1110-20121109/37124_1 /TAXON_ID=174948 /ORGANISM="Symbiodinium sp., Strain CCMP421" /LENGTH=410 /DNA_ID=CAMNT_0023592555 /DNA_START=50 /DNA_END=1279 /DNA_ORIENTATION=-